MFLIFKKIWNMTLQIKCTPETVSRRRTYNTMPKTKMTNSDVQGITQKTKDWATRTSLKTGVNSCTPEGLAVPAPHVMWHRRVARVTIFECEPYLITSCALNCNEITKNNNNVWMNDKCLWQSIKARQH